MRHRDTILVFPRLLLPLSLLLVLAGYGVLCHHPVASSANMLRGALSGTVPAEQSSHEDRQRARDAQSLRGGPMRGFADALLSGAGHFCEPCKEESRRGEEEELLHGRQWRAGRRGSCLRRENIRNFTTIRGIDGWFLGNTHPPHIILMHHTLLQI